MPARRKKKMAPGKIAAWIIGAVLSILAVGVAAVALIPSTGNSGGGSGSGSSSSGEDKNLVEKVTDVITGAVEGLEEGEGGLSGIYGKIQSKGEGVISSIQGAWQNLTS